MDKQFIEMSDVIYEIKEKITDNEYMNVMDKLGKIRIKYIEDMKQDGICKCIVGETNFCTSSIESFIICKNIRHALNKYPILRNQLLLYSLYPINEYNHNQLFKSDLQLEPIDLYKIFNENEQKVYVENTKLLLLLSGNIYGEIEKIFISIAIYDYIFKNFGFLLQHFKFMTAIYNKLDELIPYTNNLTKPIIELVKKLYNLDDNPYTIFKNIIKPYYQKGLVKAQIKEYLYKKSLTLSKQQPTERLRSEQAK